jgi:hypothetical protein
VPPAECEAAFYAAQQADPAGVGIQSPESLHQGQGGSVAQTLAGLLARGQADGIVRPDLDPKPAPGGCSPTWPREASAPPPCPTTTT